MIAGLLASTFFAGHSQVQSVGRPVLGSAMPSCVSLDRSGISDHRNCTLVNLRQIDLQASLLACQHDCRINLRKTQEPEMLSRRGNRVDICRVRSPRNKSVGHSWITGQ